MSEIQIPIVSVRAGLYKSENGAWVAIDSGICRVEIVENKSNGVHKIVAIDAKTNQNVLNLTIAPSFIFSNASSQFGQLQASGSVYGFNFGTPEELNQFNSTLTQTKSSTPSQSSVPKQIPPQKPRGAIPQSKISNPDLKEARDEIIKTVRIEIDNFRAEIMQALSN